MEWSDGKNTFKGTDKEWKSFLAESQQDMLTPSKPLNAKPKVFIIIAIVYIILACLVALLLDGILLNYKVIAFIILLAVAGATTLYCHLCFKNVIATCVCGSICIAILGVSINLYTPEEATSMVKKTVDKAIYSE